MSEILRKITEIWLIGQVNADRSRLAKKVAKDFIKQTAKTASLESEILGVEIDPLGGIDVVKLHNEGRLAEYAVKSMALDDILAGLDPIETRAKTDIWMDAEGLEMIKSGKITLEGLIKMRSEKMREAWDKNGMNDWVKKTKKRLNLD